VKAPRVAIIGVALESNRQAPPAGENDFAGVYIMRGQDILTDARASHPRIMREASAFVRAMDATGPWEPIPVLLAACHPHGPIEAELHQRFLAEIEAGLQRAGKLDAVYVANHGAMVATDGDDPDGDIIELARKRAGNAARIVVTLDLHANISERMVENCDIIVGYRTNPHVDLLERGEEAALALRLMLAGLADPKPALIRLPLTPASVTLLTHEGPYADLIDYGQRRQAEHSGAILNVSVFGGFAFSDSDKTGLAVVVTARHDLAAARLLAKEIAEKAWAVRTRFRKRLTPLESAISLALQQDRQPIIFSDAGDNPGGGGTGRTTELLAALVRSGAQDVLIGSFYDVALARAAHVAGMGAKMRARFNSDPGLPCDVPFEADAEVVGLHNGDLIGRLGIYQGKRLRLGPSAALRVGSVTVVVISDRSQTADPMFFEMFDLDIGQAHTVAVKSRGHFRAGFRPWFPPERVYEVDTAGLTSPALERRQWTRLPRPVYPLDEHASWTSPNW